MSILFAFLIAWAVLIFSLKVVDILNEGALSRSLERHNVTLKFGYFSFQTTHLNTFIDRFAQRYRRQLMLWFDIGVYLGLFGLLLSLALLSLNISQTLTSHRNPDPPVFDDRPRVPLTHSRPPWLPRYVWSLFTATDHHHSATVPALGQPDLPNAAKHDLDPASSLRLDKSEHPETQPDQQSGPRGCGKGAKNLSEAFGRLYTPSLWATKRRRRRHHSRHPYYHRRHRHRRRHSHHPDRHRPGHGQLRDQEDILSDKLRADLAGIDAFHAGSSVDDYPRTPNGLPKPPDRRVHRRTRRLLALEANSTASSANGSNSQPQASHTQRRRFLTPLVPGVTVPAGDVWYMLATVLIAALVHEFGHGIAAAAQDGEVVSVGAFVALLLPGAFVKFCGIQMLRPYAQLRVFCAGAWHNLVSGVLALLTVRFLSTLAAPAYAVGKGALVVGVPPVSPLSGHVLVGDLMHELGGRPVLNGGDSFRSAVRSLVESGDSVGFCIMDAAVQSFPPGVNSSLSSCCNGASDDGDCFRKQGLQRTLACVHPKLISSVHTCQLSLDCVGEEVRKAARAQAIEAGIRQAAGEDGKVLAGRSGVGCYIPVFEEGRQLVDVRVRSGRSGEREHYFFEGPPHILGQSLTVSSYVPRVWETVPWGVLQVIAAADAPNIAERFLQYMASISFGLAVLNMAPVLFLDGQASSGMFVKWLFPKMKERQVKRMRAATVLLGSCLMAVNMVLSIVGVEWS